MPKPKSKQERVVIARTYSAGVHVGVFKKLKGTELHLTNAVRIWRWYGANTLNELALRGASMRQFTRISEPVKSIILTQAIEVIDCEPEAAKNLRTPRWLND